MIFGRPRLVVAPWVLLALALPSALGAQGNSPNRPKGDVPITILQTTDLHHHANGTGHVGLDVDPVSGTAVLGAYSRIASYVDFVRSATKHPVVLVDSGDWTMGTLYDLTLGSEPLALSFLKRMRYDCVTLGNHEFDYTPRGLAQMLAAAQTNFGFRTPIVSSNMALNGDPDLAPFVGDGKLIQESRVEDLPNGVRVGFIGLMGKDAASAAPVSAPVTFKTDYAALQALVNTLRTAKGVQLVIALSHSGTNAAGTAGEDVDLARHVTGIDVIASGHTHTPLAGARTIVNGSWSTFLVDAGAFGTAVARIDLTYHPATNTTTLDASSSPSMTDDVLADLRRSLGPDPAFTNAVLAVDQALNVELGPFFGATFPDYDPLNLGTGVYHPVAVAAQNMVSNEKNPVVCPNGLGDLAADALRNVPNTINAQTLAAVGGNPANLPGYDFTPYQAAVVATGVLRDPLVGGVPLTFADVYDVLPLGFTPDPTQALPVTYPAISIYLELADVKKACALQVVAQTNLVAGQFYLNFSGIRYSLKPVETYLYFKYATAAAVLQVTSQRAATGSLLALQALGALSTLGGDGGAALLAAAAGGNPYAGAMVSLNDVNPTNPQIAANLGALGQVAAAAAKDAALGTSSLSALVVGKAVDAIDTVSGFAPNDAENTGATSVLSGGTRVRVAVDLYAVLLLGAVADQFGIVITPFAAATGPAVLSAANLPGLLANRIDAAPGTPGIQELKEWMALLSYVGTGLAGSIGPEYASTPNFTQFGSFGNAVRVRNASYPIASIGQLVGTLGGLLAAP